jgi:hypothetical protein
MVTNQQHAGDVSGLEEVFRSRERSRASVAGGQGPVSTVHLTDHAGPVESNLPRPRRTASAVALRRREPARYRTIAALSALAALAVAGVGSGPGQHHGAPGTSAQVAQGPTRPQRDFHAPGAPSTGQTSPGLTAERSRALLSGMPSFATRRTGEGPGAHVPPTGTDTTSGAAASALPIAPSRGSPGGGTTGSTPASSSTPLSPVGPDGGSTVDPLEGSMTSLTKPLASEAPAVAPAAIVAGNVAAAVDQVVRTTTL